MKTERIRPQNFIASSLAIILSGLLTLMSFSEWYIIKIQKRISEYPFGSEGQTPYYYQSAELYSSVNLISGIIFLSIMVFALWSLIKGKRKRVHISLGITIVLMLMLLVNGQIGTN